MAAESDWSGGYDASSDDCRSDDVGLAWSEDSTGGHHWTSGDVVDWSDSNWSGPACRVRSVASWAHWWWWGNLNSDFNWSSNFNRPNDFGDDWDSSESGDFGISLSLDPLESFVLHDQEGNLGHGLGEDVFTVDVDAVVVGGDWNWSRDDFLFLDDLDDLLWHVVDLGSSLDDLADTSEVETIGDDVGAVSSPRILVQVGVGQLVVGLVEIVVSVRWLATSVLRVCPSRVNPSGVVASRVVTWLGWSAVEWVTNGLSVTSEHLDIY